jgi:hypothetical protein
MKITKKYYEDCLNELGIPVGCAKSDGGLVPDFAKYGSWVRRNDPIGFEVGFQDVQKEEEYKSKI